MTEDRSERALRDALVSHVGDEEFAPLDPDALRARVTPRVTPRLTQGDRRRRRTTPTVLAVAAALLMMLVLPVAMLLPRLAGQSASSSSGQPASAPDVAADASSAESGDRTETYTNPAAAAPCPTAGDALGGIADYPALLVWDGRTYVGTVRDATGPVGTVVGTVRCPLLTISEDGTRAVSQPWPDGTSTLPAESVIHEVPGEEPRCTLAVRFDDRDALLHARDTPGCPTP